MKSLIYESESAVYPGRFIPLLEENDIVKEHRRRGKEKWAQPATNIIDKEHFVSIEIVIPGVKREDFCVKVNRNRLTVIVLHESSAGNIAANYKVQEFDCNFFEKELQLPANADAQLARAEYREGILYLYIPKSDHPLDYTSCSIVVY